MRISILQHSDDSPPGALTDFFLHRGLKPKVVRLHQGDRLPSLNEVDWVIVLGGEMSVDDLDEHPWLKDEKAFLSQAISLGKTCLGLCLGGQLLAQSLGGKVSRNGEWEVGWHPVQIDGQSLTVFQWHQDTYTLPQMARRIATNEVCKEQGFIFGDFVIGLQFHPEATESWIKSCLDENESEYPIGNHVQDKKTILAANDHNLPVMRAWFFKLLENLELKTGQRLMAQQPMMHV